MRSKLLLLAVWLLLAGITLPLFAASTPVVNDGKWYYVKSQRFNTGGPWWTFDATNKVVVPGALTKSDNQKFTLVQIGTTDKVTIKEFSGLKFTANVGLFDAEGALTGWTLTPNVVQGVTGYAFPGEQEGIHQGSSSWNWQVRANGWYDLTDFCTFFFYEATEDVNLSVAIDDAVVKLNSVVVGTGVGQTPQADIDNFQSAINNAKLTLGSTDQTAIQNAIDVLTTATNTFINAKIAVVTSSNAASPVWYLIKNTARDGKGATLYTNGFNATLKGTSVANSVLADGTSTGGAAPTLNHLFRFEKQSDAAYVIVNAALPDGEILQASAGGYSSQPVKYGTPATPPTKWNVEWIGYNGTLNVNEIRFVSAGNGTVCHLDGSYNVVSWASGTGSASAWYVEQFTGNVSALFQTQYDALHNQYILIADVDGNAVAPYVIGLNPGQYNAAKFQAVKDAYAAMVAEKNTNGVTSAGIIAKFAILTTAIAEFKASKVAPVAYAGTIEAGKAYTLKLVQPGSAQDGYYLANPRLDANNGADGTRPYATFVQDVDAATTVWKFVASATAGKYIITSNRRANEYVDEEGRVRDASSYGDNDWVYKTLMQNTLTYEDGATLLIVKIDKNANYFTTTGAAAATLGRNATAWSTFKVEPYVSTSVSSDVVSNVQVKVVNRMLVVNGSEEAVNVFSVTGAKVDAKNELNPGIYIVKVGHETFKVNVR